MCAASISITDWGLTCIHCMKAEKMPGANKMRGKQAVGGKQAVEDMPKNFHDNIHVNTQLAVG